ncbi:MAG: Holliday junction branch migration protein RuvA [Firmicutes bacterium]|nr:Holliday junction branch migration protein RuvA [Bacillota bacterium]
MLSFIKGTVAQVLPGMIVLENQGIGYEINVPDGCKAVIAEGTGETVTLYTEMVVREDDVSLYGFSDRESLAFFKLLKTVNGVGAKAALAILSVLDPPSLKQAIAFEDPGPITRANGVGKKIAQRIVMELKDKVEGFDTGSPLRPAAAPLKKGSGKEQAADALVALGYSRSEALAALASVSEEDLTTEEYIRLALKQRR